MDKSKNVKEWADILSSLGSALFKYGGSLGVLVVFIYCASVVHFFPTGLSIGDSVLLVFAALGFGFTYLICLGFGAATIAVVLLLFPWFRNSAEPFIKLLTVLCTAFALFVIASPLSNHPEKWHSLAAICVGGFGIVLNLAYAAYGKPGMPALGSPSEIGEDPAPLLDHDTGPLATVRTRGSASGRIIALTASVLAPLVIAGELDQNLAIQAFSYIGVRAERASLVVDESNYKSIESAAAQLRIPVLGCDIEGTNQLLVHNMRVLWHGIGERSLVEFLRPDADGNLVGIARLELKRDGLKILTPSETSRAAKPEEVEACVTLQTDAYFNTYDEKPNALGVSRLNGFKKQWQDYLQQGHLRVIGATIEGHADRVPVNHVGDNNQLSERRAKAVRDALHELWAGRSDSDIEAVGVGSSEPKTSCSESLQGERLIECLAEDRRVVIKLRLSLPKLTGDSRD